MVDKWCDDCKNENHRILLNAFHYFESRRNYAPSYTYENLEPIAGNYYPINSRIIINDTEKQMTILTDRSEGGGSMVDGQIEIMVSFRFDAYIVSFSCIDDVSPTIIMVSMSR